MTKQLRKKDNCNKRNKGFSLVEVLATIAILCILMAVGVVAYTSWQKTAEFNYNNETAKTIYTALQSELSAQKSGNSLGPVEKNLKNWSASDDENTKAYCGALDDDLLSKLTLADITLEIINDKGESETLKQVAKTGTTYEEIYKGLGSSVKRKVYYLKATAADWAKYLDDDANNDQPQAKLLYDLLSQCFNEKDRAFLDGSVCIEFDASEGLVYSVFYCKGDKSNLNYNVGAEYNMINRTKAARKDNGLVGYYGVRNLAMVGDLLLGSPKLENVKLNNEETLNLSFKTSMPAATSKLTYEVFLYDSKDTEGKKPLVGIRMNKLEKGTSLKNKVYDLKSTKKAEATAAVGALIADCEVTKYYEDGGKSKAGEQRYMTFPAWIDADGKVTLVLDAVDFNVASESKQAAYKSYLNSKNAASVAGAVPAKGKFVSGLYDTFSIYRLGIEDHDNIYCTVQGIGGNYRPTKVEKSNDANRAFAKSTTAEHKFELGLSRHLYNVRFEETAASRNPSANYEYALTGGFSWKKATAITTDTENTAAGDTSLGNVYAIDPDLFNGINSAEAVIKSGETTGLSASFGTIGQKICVGNYENSQDKILAGKDAAFPSLTGLRAKSVVTSDVSSGKGYRISNLVIDKDANDKWIKASGTSGTTSTSTAKTESTGLFLENSGKISKVILENIKVKGEEKTGAFCGIDKGTLNNLSVYSRDEADKIKSDASTVEGTTEVGGILGAWENKKSFEALQTLNNEATVIGSKLVGGILGRLTLKENEKKSLTITECENKGVVLGKNAESSFIGGIAGMIAKPGNDKNHLGDYGVTITNCKSEPIYVNDEQKKNRNGYCVGGIVGFCYNGQVKSSCKVKKNSLITGGNYVGGIIGMFTGIVDMQTVATEGTGNSEANVAGKNYVGGVAGCSSALKVEGKTLSQWILDNGDNWYTKLTGKMLEIDESNPTASIKDWLANGEITGDSDGKYTGGVIGYNCGELAYSGIEALEGKVTGGDYVGGLTGYNAGTVMTVNSVSVKRKILGTNYIGGLTGYNGGVLGDGDNHNIKSNETVDGKSFVGGIVGYNDTDAVIHGNCDHSDEQKYRVKGSGSFVGGLVGVNCSVNTAQHLESSNAVTVTGKYCVGGLMGGNVLRSNGSVEVKNKTIKANVTAGGGVAGGYIGYNKMLGSTSVSKAELRAGLTKLADSLSNKGDYAGVMELLASEVVADGNLTKGKMVISSTSDEAGKIKGGVFSGGFIGYNADNTKLTMGKLTNKAEWVEVTSKIKGTQLYNVPESVVTNSGYGFVGGIIGYVGENTTLKTCKNEGTVKGGTYTGGLCEVNKGTIEGCTVYAPTTDAKTERVGGLCGVNFGTVKNPKFGGNKVVGSSGTGGIASENYGTINVTNKDFGTVSVEGGTGSDVKNIGGIVAYNIKLTDAKYAGKISFTDNSTALEKVKVDVTASDASNVGGIVGQDRGGSVNTSDEKGKFIKTTVTGTVIGKNSVGGAIGTTGNTAAGVTGSVITGFDADVGLTVTASKDNAGGVVGTMASESVIVTECVNNGKVESNQYAGGIVGNASAGTGTITNCENKGKLSIAKYLGGIAGGVSSDNMTVSDCVNNGKTGNNETEYAGGIIGKISAQKAVVTKCVNHESVEGKRYAGGIVGGVAHEGEVVATISESKNFGEIKTTGEGAGGIVGGNGAHYLFITDSFNKNAVKSEGNAVATGLNCNATVGGILGKSNGQENIFRCRNYGESTCGADAGDKNNASGIASNFNDMVECFDFRPSSVSKLTTGDDEPRYSYFYSKAMESIFEGEDKSSENFWLRQYRRGWALAASVKTAFKSRVDELGRKGLPVGIHKYTFPDDYVFSSYKIWDNIYNPVFKKTIPGVAIEDLKKFDLDQSKEVTEGFNISNELYNVMESYKSGLGYVEDYFKRSQPEKETKKVSGIGVSQNGKKLSATWKETKDAYGYKVMVAFVGGTSGAQILHTSYLVPSESWSCEIPDEWYNYGSKGTVELHVFVRAVYASELPRKNQLFDLTKWESENPVNNGDFINKLIKIK